MDRADADEVSFFFFLDCSIICILSSNREYLETGSSGFFHTDLVGRRYMCYLLSRSAKLQLILMDGDTNVHTDGIVGSISARDAVAFPVSLALRFSR